MDRVVISPLAALACLMFVVGPADAGAQAIGAQTVDPVFQRAQQMVAAGQDSAGRAVVDSVLAMRAEGTPLYAEALFWRARLSRTAAAAERDYRRISVEYPLSPRAAESLLLLAQLELTRGDRASARAHLARLQREHPTAPIGARASVTLARLAFDDGDVATGCAAVAAGREALGPSDVELRNQLEFFGQRCANVAGRDVSAPASSAMDTGAARDTGAGAEPPTVTREFSVQVAAYETRASADALVQRLVARGYEARVVGDTRPFRVRVGRYATREGAAEVVRQLSRSNTRGFVVEAEP
jgi:cell division septation protein DedD